MNAVEIAEESTKEILKYIRSIDAEAAEVLIDKILSAQRIFIAGAGRSGLMLRAFAMRLMHLGFKTYVVGEVTTPALEEGDLILFGSGSGETSTLILMAQKAQKIGAQVALITIFPESSLGKISDLKITIVGRSNKVASSVTSVQPGGNLFEQSMLIFLDAVIIRIAERENIDTAKFKRHANLE